MRRPGSRPPPPAPPEDRVPHVVFQPFVAAGMRQGINQLVAAVRPTLGPTPRIVALARGQGNQRPELLDNGGLIARRIVALPNQNADMGAMLLRSLLWRQHEQQGDGAATTAVLFQSIYNQGLQHLAAGGNAMRLRHYLEAGLRAILDELAGMVDPVEGRSQLQRLAQTLCYDPALAEVLGEVMDVIGEYGQLEVKQGRSRNLELEFFGGSYWKGSLLASALLKGAEQRAELREAAVVISDLNADEPADVFHLVDLARQAGAHSLLLIAANRSDKALAAVLTVHRAYPAFRVLAVKTPGKLLDDQVAAMEDLSFLTGGRPLLGVTGQTLASATGLDLGQARHAWGDREHFGLTGGQGSSSLLRQHIAQLKAAHANSQEHDVRERLQRRLGRLSAGAAALTIGGATEPEIAARKEAVVRTVAALRGALRQGVVPGGGAALLWCCRPLQARLGSATDPDEQAACKILLTAMETPLRTIVANAGGQPSRAIAGVRAEGRGHGYDVVAERVTDMVQAGIVDIASVVRAAVHGAVSSAALALTVDVLVQHKQPVIVYTP